MRSATAGTSANSSTRLSRNARKSTPAHHLAGSHQRQCPSFGRTNHQVDHKTDECTRRTNAHRQAEHSDDVSKHTGVIGLLEGDVDARGIVGVDAPEELGKPHSESFGLVGLGRSEDPEHARLKAVLRASPGHVAEVGSAINRSGSTHWAASKVIEKRLALRKTVAQEVCRLVTRDEKFAIANYAPVFIHDAAPLTKTSMTLLREGLGESNAS